MGTIVKAEAAATTTLARAAAAAAAAAAASALPAATAAQAEPEERRRRRRRRRGNRQNSWFGRHRLRRRERQRRRRGDRRGRRYRRSQRPIRSRRQQLRRQHRLRDRRDVDFRRGRSPHGLQSLPFRSPGDSRSARPQRRGGGLRPDLLDGQRELLEHCQRRAQGAVLAVYRTQSYSDNGASDVFTGYDAVYVINLSASAALNNPTFGVGAGLSASLQTAGWASQKAFGGSGTRRDALLVGRQRRLRHAGSQRHGRQFQRLVRQGRQRRRVFDFRPDACRGRGRLSLRSAGDPKRQGQRLVRRNHGEHRPDGQHGHERQQPGKRYGDFHDQRRGRGHGRGARLARFATPTRSARCLQRPARTTLSSRSATARTPSRRPGRSL